MRATAAAWFSLRPSRIGRLPPAPPAWLMHAAPSTIVEARAFPTHGRPQREPLLAAPEPLQTQPPQVVSAVPAASDARVSLAPADLAASIPPAVPSEPPSHAPTRRRATRRARPGAGGPYPASIPHIAPVGAATCGAGRPHRPTRHRSRSRRRSSHSPGACHRGHRCAGCTRPDHGPHRRMAR